MEMGKEKELRAENRTGWRAGRVNAPESSKITLVCLPPGRSHAPLAYRFHLRNRLSDDLRGALGLGGRDIEMRAGTDRLRTRKMDKDAALL